MQIAQLKSVFLLSALCGLPCAALAQSYSYKVTQLAPDGSYATAINNAGQVTGRLTPDAGEHAFLYEHGVLTDLGTLPGDRDSFAAGINDAGKVVGTSYAGVGARHGFVFSKDGMADIGSLDSGATSAQAINDRGQVVGRSVVAGHFYMAFLYDDGVMQNLGALPGGDRSGASAINNKGQIAGSSALGVSQGPHGEEWHAIVYEHGVMKDIGTLGGLSSEAYDINDRGQVVGYSQVAGAEPWDTHAFIYENGVMRDLGLPSRGGTGAMAEAINNHGQVVGSFDLAGPGRGFVYDKQRGMRDLTSLVDPASGWYIEYAHDINDLGQIVGLGCRGQVCAAVRLDPVPQDDAAPDEQGAPAEAPAPGVAQPGRKPVRLAAG